MITWLFLRDFWYCYNFSKKSREMENIPPSQAALLEHSKRAVFQAGHIWGQTLVSEPEVPTPGEWGWEELDKKWSILWTQLPEASKSCLELLFCKCQKVCKGNCKCYKRNLKCTSLCARYGQCYQNYVVRDRTLCTHTHNINIFVKATTKYHPVTLTEQ